jgi:hypothetical protein
MNWRKIRRVAGYTALATAIGLTVPTPLGEGQGRKIIRIVSDQAPELEKKGIRLHDDFGATGMPRFFFSGADSAGGRRPLNSQEMDAVARSIGDALRRNGVNGVEFDGGGPPAEVRGGRASQYRAAGKPFILRWIVPPVQNAAKRVGREVQKSGLRRIVERPR